MMSFSTEPLNPKLVRIIEDILSILAGSWSALLLSPFTCFAVQ